MRMIILLMWAVIMKVVNVIDIGFVIFYHKEKAQIILN